MIYIKEYKESKNINDFADKVLKLRNNQIKKQSAKRYYYVLKEHFSGNKKNKKKNKTKKPIILKRKKQNIFTLQPNSAKLLQLMQLKESGFKITREFMVDNYYSNEQIKWLVDHKMVEEE
jgi:hypothetical protein